jgi:hypothetical protein
MGSEQSSHHEGRPSLIPPVPTSWNHPQETYDWLDYQLSRVAAAFIRECPDKAIDIARKNLIRWKERNGSIQYVLRGTYDRWMDILSTKTPEEIASLLEEDSSLAQQLRSSTPFVGLPCFDESWVKPLRIEVGRQSTLAGEEYKRRFKEKELAAIAASRV